MAKVVTVDALRPDSKGVTLTLKVVDAKVVVDRPRGPKGSLKVVECLVGDSTGVIILSAKNEQADLAVKGATIIVSNASIELIRGSMRLSGGTMESTDDQVTPNTDNNMSLIEFEVVLLPNGSAQPAS